MADGFWVGPMVFATFVYMSTEVIQIDCGTKGEQTEQEATQNPQ